MTVDKVVPHSVYFSPTPRRPTRPCNWRAAMKTIDAGGTGFLRTFWSEHKDCLPAAVAAVCAFYAVMVTI